MTTEEMERAIEFLLDHHAKVSADIERHSEQIAQLTTDVQALTKTVASTQSQLDSVISEMHDGFNNLIVANEVTRKLSEDVALLATGIGQRMTGIDRRVTDLESKP